MKLFGLLSAFSMVPMHASSVKIAYWKFQSAGTPPSVRSCDGQRFGMAPFGGSAAVVGLPEGSVPMKLARVPSALFALLLNTKHGQFEAATWVTVEMPVAKSTFWPSSPTAEFRSLKQRYFESAGMRAPQIRTELPANTSLGKLGGNWNDTSDWVCPLGCGDRPFEEPQAASRAMNAMGAAVFTTFMIAPPRSVASASGVPRA